MVDDLLRRFGCEIIGDQPQHGVTIVPAQRADPLVSGHGGERCRGLGVGTDGLEHLGPQRHRRGGGCRDQQERFGHQQKRQRIRMSDQVVDHRLRGAHDREQARQQRPVEFVFCQRLRSAGANGREQRRGVLPSGLDDPEQPEGGTVRIRGCQKQLDEARIRGQRLAQELIELVEESGCRIRDAGRA